MKAKLTHRKLEREIESNLNSLINNRNESIWFVDNSCNFITFNNFFKKAYFVAYNIELKHGMNALKILSPELLKFWKPKYDKALSGERITFEFSNSIGNEIHFYETSLNPIILDGKVTGVSALSIDITDQRQVEKEMKMLASSISSINECISITDSNNIILFVNNAFVKTYGYKKVELIGKSISIVRPQNANVTEPIKNILRETLSGSWEGEIVNQRKDGTLFPVHLSTSLIKDNEGNTMGLIGVATDITKRKLVDKALFESEKRFKLLFENAPLSYQSLDVNACLLDVNDEWLKTFGYKREEVIGRSINNFMTPKSVELLKKQFPEFLSKGEIHAVEFEMIRKNGEHFIISNEGKIGYDADGNFKQTHCILKDITNSKKAEKALKESEKSYASLFNSVTEAIYLQNKDGTFIDVNNGAVRMYGYSREELISSTPKKLAAPDINDLPYVSRLIKKVLESGDPETFEFWGKRKNGEIFPKEVIASRISYFGKDIILASSRDITERKHIEAELMAAKEKAEESDSLKSAFLANMSHEIRTPMNGILGFARLLKEPELTGKQQQEYISIIEKGGARMLNIINDIVSISKIESGQMEVNLKETNINKQIEYIYTFFKPEVERKGMQFLFKNSLLLSEAIIITDREKIYAILTNLVKNAIKYTHKGSIEVGYNQKDDFFEFYVKDTGIGIPVERQDAIFKRFIQADIEDKNAYQGAGLGLSISKAYVEMLGGKIWVESEEGDLPTSKAGGSTFYFTLPHQSETIKDNLLKQEALTSVEGASLNNLKILIVEDDETSKDFISIIVDKYGREIITVINGTEAVEVCLKNPDIDLVLMDIQLPEMNGYEATRQIRKFNKEVIIIAQTAFALEGDQEKAISAGCNDYISKPIDTNKLKLMMAKYLKK